MHYGFLLVAGSSASTNSTWRESSTSLPRDMTAMMQRDVAQRRACNKVVKFIHAMAVLFMFCLLLSLSLVVSEQGANSYEKCPLLNLNGLVFPDYSSRPVEHALHWSKAQSKPH